MARLRRLAAGLSQRSPGFDVRSNSYGICGQQRGKETDGSTLSPLYLSIYLFIHSFTRLSISTDAIRSQPSTASLRNAKTIYIFQAGTAPNKALTRQKYDTNGIQELIAFRTRKKDSKFCSLVTTSIL